MPAVTEVNHAETLNSFVERKFPSAKLELLSESNNEVQKVVLPDKKAFVIKRISDNEIPVPYMIEVSRALALSGANSIPAEIIFQDKASTIIVMSFLDGQPISEWLPSVSEASSFDKYSDFMSAFITQCSELPRFRPGYGLYKNIAPVFESAQQFMAFYAIKYWSRVRPTLNPKSHVLPFIDEWLSCGLRGIGAGTEGCTVPIDSNLKNFLRLNSGDFCALNVPIVGFSTRAHALGATSFHLRYTQCWNRFWQVSSVGLTDEELVAALQLELWQILGVMSFYSGREPNTSESWRNWGSPVTLLQHLDDLVCQLKEQGLFRSSLLKKI